MAPPTLESLPLEILFHILSYTSPYSVLDVPNHPLLCTAATSISLCNLVEEYCCSLLKIHNVKIPKAPKKGVFLCRMRWFTWVKSHCAICSKPSKRKAILQAGMICCKGCDNTHFPKMTQTAAIKEHGLSKLDLFTPNILHPHLPPLILGSYMVMGGEALMISESSVLQRKAYIRSLLDPAVRDDAAYLRRRSAMHYRITQMMGIHYRVRECKVVWAKDRPFSLWEGPEGPERMRCAGEYLMRERAAMGMGELNALSMGGSGSEIDDEDQKGASAEMPIEIG